MKRVSKQHGQHDGIAIHTFRLVNVEKKKRRKGEKWGKEKKRHLTFSYTGVSEEVAGTADAQITLFARWGEGRDPPLPFRFFSQESKRALVSFLCLSIPHGASFGSRQVWDPRPTPHPWRSPVGMHRQDLTARVTTVAEIKKKGTALSECGLKPIRWRAICAHA